MLETGFSGLLLLAVSVFAGAMATPLWAQSNPSGSGTGFLVNSEGWLVTNAHVVEGCERIAVAGRGYSSDRKLDVQNDLALLRIPTTTESIPLVIRKSPARLGEDIAAFGYPLSDVLSSSVKVTTGNVNSLLGIGDDTRYLQISTPIQPGNSGGPVADRSGALLGITTATLKPQASGGSVPQNVNFAIRASVMKAFSAKQVGIIPIDRHGCSALRSEYG